MAASAFNSSELKVCLTLEKNHFKRGWQSNAVYGVCN